MPLKNFDVGRDMMRLALGEKWPVLQHVMVNGVEGTTVEKKRQNLGKRIVFTKIFRLKCLQFCSKNRIENILYLAEFALSL